MQQVTETHQTSKNSTPKHKQRPRQRLEPAGSSEYQAYYTIQSLISEISNMPSNKENNNKSSNFVGKLVKKLNQLSQKLKESEYQPVPTMPGLNRGRRIAEQKQRNSELDLLAGTKKTNYNRRKSLPPPVIMSQNHICQNCGHSPNPKMMMAQRCSTIKNIKNFLGNSDLNNISSVSLRQIDENGEFLYRPAAAATTTTKTHKTNNTPETAIYSNPLPKISSPINNCRPKKSINSRSNNNSKKSNFSNNSSNSDIELCMSMTLDTLYAEEVQNNIIDTKQRDLTSAETNYGIVPQKTTIRSAIHTKTSVDSGISRDLVQQTDFKNEFAHQFLSVPPSKITNTRTKTTSMNRKSSMLRMVSGASVADSIYTASSQDICQSIVSLRRSSSHYQRVFSNQFSNGDEESGIFV